MKTTNETKQNNDEYEMTKAYLTTSPFSFRVTDCLLAACLITTVRRLGSNPVRGFTTEEIRLLNGLLLGPVPKKKKTLVKNN